MKTKKRNYFAIWGRNMDTGKKEKLDQTNNEKNAYYLIREYSISYGQFWHIFCPQLKEV